MITYVYVRVMCVGSKQNNNNVAFNVSSYVEYKLESYYFHFKYTRFFLFFFKDYNY